MCRHYQVVHFVPYDWIPLGAWAGAIDEVTCVMPVLVVR